MKYVINVNWQNIFIVRDVENALLIDDFNNLSIVVMGREC